MDYMQEQSPPASDPLPSPCLAANTATTLATSRSSFTPTIGQAAALAKEIVLYARVSSEHQRGALQRQIDDRKHAYPWSHYRFARDSTTRREHPWCRVVIVSEAYEQDVR